MRILDAWSVPLPAPSLMSEALAVQYDAEIPVSLVAAAVTSLPSLVQAFLRRDEILLQRWHKKGARQVNIRPGIIRLEVMPHVGAMVTLAMLVREEAEVKAKPLEVMQALFNLNAEQLRSVRIYKREAFVHAEGRLIPIMHYHPLGARSREVHA
jgi:hypothetical protein